MKKIKLFLVLLLVGVLVHIVGIYHDILLMEVMEVEPSMDVVSPEVKDVLTIKTEKRLPKEEVKIEEQPIVVTDEDGKTIATPSPDVERRLMDQVAAFRACNGLDPDPEQCFNLTITEKFVSN